MQYTNALASPDVQSAAERLCREVESSVKKALLNGGLNPEYELLKVHASRHCLRFTQDRVFVEITVRPKSGGLHFTIQHTVELNTQSS